LYWNAGFTDKDVQNCIYFKTICHSKLRSFPS
jgi:hypothetical protein